MFPQTNQVWGLSLAFKTSLKALRSWFKGYFKALKDDLTSRSRDNQRSYSFLMAFHRELLYNDPQNPYVCTFGCGKSFGQGRKDDWRNHEETHWPQDFFLCGLDPCCTKDTRQRYARQDKFRAHLKREHYLSKETHTKQELQELTTASRQLIDSEFLGPASFGHAASDSVAGERGSIILRSSITRQSTMEDVRLEGQ